MKRFLTLFLVALALLSASCKNESLIEYIERGFNKPQVGDVHFNISNLGSDNKIYVPSENEIEVEFSIKNQYQRELKGEVSIDEDDLVLFSTAPYVKELTFTKMVIAFDFKNQGEPSSQNAFLGASVPISLKIFDKKTGHFFSSRDIIANCNTPPLPIQPENIQYDIEKDEYVVELPKNDGKHSDLKEVRFFLSSTYGTEIVREHIVPVLEENAQNTIYRMKVKGSEEWQLKNPSGDRKLESTVYDKAGLKSGKGVNEVKRIFTNITLVPSNIDVSLDDIGDGVPVPTIKELAEYFHDKDWEKAGYRVSYQSDNFSYDEANGVLIRKGDLSEQEYDVTVKLENDNGMQPTATYKITAVLGALPSINQSKLKITDETEYKDLPDGAGPLILSGETIDFQDVANAKEGTLTVPYTGFKTNIKVHAQAFNSNGIIQDESGSEYGNTKEFDLILDENVGSIKTLTFFVAKTGTTIKKKYVIKFVRGESVYAKVTLQNELLHQDNCNVKMSWKYGEKAIPIKTDEQTKTDGLYVAKGAKVRFEITAGDGHMIKECTSTYSDHNTIIASGGTEFHLTATEDFTLDVTFRAESSFKWLGIKKANSEGYTKAKVSYYSNNALTHKEFTTQGDTPEVPIQKGKECKFSIEGLNAEKHKVLYWIINEERIRESKSDGSIELNTDKTILTIKEVTEDLYIKVFTIELYELEVKICDENNGDITNHNYTFEVRKNQSSGSILQANSSGKYVGIASGTQLYITAEEGPNSKYDINKWERKLATDPSFTTFTGGEITKRNFNITGNNIIKVILKKKIFKIKWSVQGGDAGLLAGMETTISAKVDANPVPAGNTEANVEIDRGMEFEVTQLEEGRDIKGWKVANNLYDATEISKNITISSNKKKLTLTDIKENTEVALVLTPKKYTIKVEIVKPQGATEENKYTIKATNKGTVVLPTPNTTYTFAEVEHDSESNWKFEAIPNGSQYLVKKWQWVKEDSTQGDISDSQYVNPNDKKVIKWAPNGDITLKVILLKPVARFSLIRKDSANGKLQIRESSDDSSPQEVATDNGFVDIDVGGGKRLYLNVEGLLADKNKILSWKLNGKEEKGTFLGDDGFWKGEGSDKKFDVVFNPGDKVEVTIGAVQWIRLKVEEENSLYNNNAYKLIVKQSESDRGNKDHVLLPIKEEIVITHAAIQSAGTDGYPIYFTQGTSLDFKMNGLPEDKEIGEWKKDSTILDSTFNNNHNDDGLRIGKNEIKNYVAPSSNAPFSIVAKIRKATKLINFYIEDYKDRNKVQDAKVEFSVSYSGSHGDAQIVSIRGDEDCPKGYRVEKDSKLKLKIEEKTGNKYYFVQWKSDSLTIIPTDQHKKEIEVSVNNAVSEVNALFTKNVIVKVDKMRKEDRNASHLDPDYFSDPVNGDIGFAKVGEMVSGSFQEKYQTKCDVGGVWVSDISIEDFANANGGNLAIQYFKSNLFSGAKVYWNYDFEDHGYNYTHNTENSNTGIKTQGTQILEFKNPPKCAILYICLYKVKKP